MRKIGKLFRFTTGLVLGTCVGATGMLLLVCELEECKKNRLARAKKEELKD